MHYILKDRKAVPVKDVLEWARWFETADRKVALTQVADGISVSTVFLGLDHSFMPDAPPLIFETMVFGGPLDANEDRYTTWEDAEAGHAAMVAEAEAALTT